jgi:hypothetical protein
MSGKLKYLGKSYPTVILSTTTPILPDLGTNPVHRGGKPMANCLMHTPTPRTRPQQMHSEITNFFNFIAVNNTNIPDTLTKIKLGAIIPKTGLFTLFYTMCRLLVINIYEMKRSLAEINFHLTKEENKFL